MKNSLILLLLSNFIVTNLSAQEITPGKKQTKDIHSLIEDYSKARENKDTVLLSHILTEDIDQLVSSGKWRKGKEESMKGMLQSSKNNPGTRTLKIENIRLLNPQCAIVDARYEIKNTNGTTRKMWSSFIVVFSEDEWKISAIRNMLPAG
ncbi:nuclear transport factor 2 family protein [uncultured Eudoraea sp.]|uniref:YybH family protein n=1 Tax=uncultured Eudoraea sp. TaxID=1035614 RepID=UPI0026230914|nr:nuclear transport factor 2 family protein [uncultured Eudoraea sp.]